MTDLTEKWKKEELEKGKLYFCRTVEGNIDVCKLDSLNDMCGTQGYYHMPQDENSFEVLSPCDYEELERLKEENKNLYNMLDVLNRHLDLLLKEDNENPQLISILKEYLKILDRIKSAISESEE